jgi:hypothetical protein
MSQGGMPITLHQDALFEAKGRCFCTYEVFLEGGCIYVGCGTLNDALELRDMGRNSELAKIYVSASSLQVRIIATSTSLHECKIYMLQRVRQYSPMPHCNRYGILMTNVRNNVIIESNDGRSWSTQEECAADLFLTQPHVSKMINTGKPNSRGLVLRKKFLHT